MNLGVGRRQEYLCRVERRHSVGDTCLGIANVNLLKHYIAGRAVDDAHQLGLTLAKFNNLTAPLPSECPSAAQLHLDRCQTLEILSDCGQINSNIQRRR